MFGGVLDPLAIDPDFASVPKAVRYCSPVRIIALFSARLIFDQSLRGETKSVK